MTKDQIHLDDFPRYSEESDDRGRFRRAIAATPYGGTLFVPKGEYVADSICIHHSINLVFSTSAKVIAVEPNRDIFTVKGSRDPENYVLQQPLKRGDQVLQLTEIPPDWKSGDLIIVTDDTVRFGDGQKDVNTEIHEIAFIEENQIFLCDFIRFPKSISTQGVNLYRVHPLEDICINNFSYQLQEGSVKGNGLTLCYTRGAKIVQLKAYRGAGSGIQVKKSMNTHVERFQYIHPQVTGSGQGYGVQFFSGCHGVFVRGGYTWGCRHAVDLDGSFDARICHVTDYYSFGAAFVMSHNGWTSDILFEQCQTFHTRGSGFCADSQGFSNPLACTFYNFTILNCRVIMKNSANACIYFYSPCKNVTIRDCQLSYRLDRSAVGINNAGIRVYPAKSEVLIDHCQIHGVRRGIALQVARQIQYENDQSQIIIRDTMIQKCDAAILCHNGSKRNVLIYQMTCDQIMGKIFEFHGQGTFAEWVMDGLSIQRSPNISFCTGVFQGKNVCGSIRNIRTDRPLICSFSKNLWTLSLSDLFLHGDGESVFLQGKFTQSSQNPLPDGWVEGQKLILIVSSGRWVIQRGKNMLFKKNLSRWILDRNDPTICFIWRGGKWNQL